jgi:lipopolysaccharide biosynthesis glycosyltransferase
MWLLFCTDEKYVGPTAVALFSAARSLEAPKDARYVVVLDRVAGELVKRLSRFGSRLGVDLELVDAAEIGFGEFAQLGPRGHLSTAAHLCLFADRAVPPMADRVLYLDSDLLVCRDLLPLFEIDLHGRAVAAARDQFAENRAHRRSGTTGRVDRPVFNTGVLVIDLARMRDGLGDRLRERALERRNDAPLADQDILNELLAHDWLEVGPEWNAHDLRPDGHLRYADAAIIHFAGWKPWQAQCSNPGRRPWRHTLRQSRWLTAWERTKWETALHAGLLWQKHLQLRYRLQIRTRARALARSLTAPKATAP